VNDAEREPRVGRRRFLRRGAITAAVAASGAAVLAQQPAGAANGQALTIGQANSGTLVTALNVTGDNTIAFETSSASGAQLRLAPNSIDVINDTTHSFTEGSLIADSTNQVLWYTYAGGSASTAGLYALNGVPVFVTLAAPLRVYDSRPGEQPLSGTKAPIGNGEDRVIQVINTSSTFVTAVLLTVTVVNTLGQGFLAVLEGSGTFGVPNAFSSMNWYLNGQILANTVVSAVNASGQVKVHCGGGGQTDFVVDTVGAWVIP
jgi:hypothetical protein